MPLLDIVQNALAEVGGAAIPSTVAGNSDDTARKALAMLQGIGKDLMKSYRWPELKKTNVFSTVANQPGYTLPSDFRRFSPMSYWDRTSHWPLNGPATDSMWQYLQSGLVTVASRFWFRIQGAQFVMAPTPVDVRTIAWDYSANTWVVGSDGTTFKTSFTADDDVTRLLPNGESDEVFRLGLIYKWKASEGAPYAEDKANYLASIDADLWDASPPPMIDVTGIPNAGYRRGILPDTGFGA